MNCFRTIETAWTAARLGALVSSVLLVGSSAVACDKTRCVNEEDAWDIPHASATSASSQDAAQVADASDAGAGDERGASPLTDCMEYCRQRAVEEDSKLVDGGGSIRRGDVVSCRSPLTDSAGKLYVSCVYGNQLCGTQPQLYR